MTIIKRTRDKYWLARIQRKPLVLWCTNTATMETSTAAMENNMENSQKIKHMLCDQESHFGVLYTKETKSPGRDICIPMFIAELLTILKTTQATSDR